MNAVTTNWFHGPFGAHLLDLPRVPRMKDLPVFFRPGVAAWGGVLYYTGQAETGLCGVSLGQRMPAQLLALTDGPSILLDKPILLLGRHPECDIQLESRKVSRRHCCIAQVGNYLVVRDLGSTNGIRINGVRAVEGCLKPGDELTIGSHRYQVQWDELARPAPPRPPRAKATDRPPTPPEPPVLPAAQDLHLEECDEPVPLADEAGPGPVLPGRKAPAPGEPPEPPGGAPPRRQNGAAAPEPQDAARAESARSHILPDHLDLAPASELRQGHEERAPQAPEPEP
jgi:hypothetical protein